MKTIQRNTAMSLMKQLIIALVVFVLQIEILQAQPADPAHRRLLMHPFFTGKNLVLASDSVLFTAHSLFSTHNPEQITICGGDTLAWFTYNNLDTIVIMPVTAIYPASNLQKVSINTGMPISIPQLSANRPYAVGYSAADNKIIHVSAAGDIVSLAFINASTLAITSTATVDYGTVNTVHALTLDSQGSDTVKLLIGGASGMIRRVPVTNGIILPAENFDISSSETVTSLDHDLAGTVSGKIFRFDTDSYTLEYTGSAKIEYFFNNGALCENNSLLLHQGTSWNGVTWQWDTTTFVQTVYRAEGTGIEAISENGNYGTVTFSDSATTLTFDDATFESAWTSSISRIAMLDGNKTTTITLTDIDHNFTLPDFNVNNGLDILKEADLPVNDTRPDRPFTDTNNDLLNPAITLSLSHDRISISLSLRKRAYNPVTLRYYWITEEKEYNEIWNTNDTITIRLGSDSLRIVNNATQTEKGLSVHYPNPTFSFSALQGHLRILNAPYSGELSCFLVSGKKIAQIPFQPGTSLLPLPATVSRSAMMIIEVKLHDGSIFTKRMNISF